MATAIVSAAQLREILEYDPESPSGLRWKVDRGHKGSGAKAGDRPGTLWKDKAGYRCWTLHAARKQWYAHPGASPTINFRVTEAQRAKFEQRGGAAWLRGLIDAA